MLQMLPCVLFYFLNVIKLFYFLIFCSCLCVCFVPAAWAKEKRSLHLLWSFPPVCRVTFKQMSKWGQVSIWGRSRVWSAWLPERMMKNPVWRLKEGSEEWITAASLFTTSIGGGGRVACSTTRPRLQPSGVCNGSTGSNVNCHMCEPQANWDVEFLGLLREIGEDKTTELKKSNTPFPCLLWE